MVTSDEIQEQFDSFGIELDEHILNKCVKLCETHYINNAEEFVEQWMAYSVSKLNGVDPTIEYLDEMERKVFAINHERLKSPIKADARISAHYSRSIEDNDIFSTYGGKIVQETSHVEEHDTAIPSTSSSSQMCTVSSTPMMKNTQQNHESGKVMYTFGNPKLIKDFINKNINLKIELIKNNEAEESLIQNARFGLDRLIDKCLYERYRTNLIGKKICEKYFKIDDDRDLTELENVSLQIDLPCQQKIYIVGRIACDNNGHLNETTTLLVGIDDVILRKIYLEFAKNINYSLFPGQIVLLSGSNPRGERFFVEEVITETDLKLPSPSLKLDSPIKIFIAAGPFTLKNNLEYDPLKKFIDYCKENKPSCIILIGPFLDQDNNVIMDSLMGEQFDLYFEKLTNIVMDNVGKDCDVFFISSCKDIRSFVYPTPPYQVNKTYPNLHLFSDPCLVSVNGLSIGITSVDILDHIISEEITSQNYNQDKIKRTINHLFNQKSFYPLNPPNLEVTLDTSLTSKFSALNEIPNLLILPSHMRYFARDINNCLSINPGFLVSSSGGTFASVVINPVEPSENVANKKLMDYMACQIIKI